MKLIILRIIYFILGPMIPISIYLDLLDLPKKLFLLIPEIPINISAQDALGGTAKGLMLNRLNTFLFFLSFMLGFVIVALAALIILWLLSKIIPYIDLHWHNILFFLIPFFIAAVITSYSVATFTLSF